MTPPDNRRRFDEDHDLIVKMHTLLVKMENTQSQHELDDKEHFARLYRGQANLRWIVGIGVGILTAVEVFVNKIFGSGTH